MKPKIDIFRPIAAVTRGCRGDSDDISTGHCTIFRKKRQESSRGIDTVHNAISDDDSFVLSMPAMAWPPNAIEGSESTDTKSNPEKPRHGLNRSAPVQVESSESRGGTTPINGHHHPSYYKIEMQGSQVQLYAGDDNSIQLTPDHNKNIKWTGSKSKNITKASPIAEQGIESPMLPIKENETGQKWTVSGNGDIIAVRDTQPVSPELDDAKLAVPSLKDSQDLNPPPILTRASSDSGSDHSNELVLPESPPRMNRSVLGHKSLFQEDSSRSSSGGSKSSPLSVSSKSISPVNIDMKDVLNSVQNPEEKQKKRHRGCGSRVDFISQALDFFNYTCGVGTVCKDGNCLSSQEPTVGA